MEEFVVPTLPIDGVKATVCDLPISILEAAQNMRSCVETRMKKEMQEVALLLYHHQIQNWKKNLPFIQSFIGRRSINCLVIGPKYLIMTWLVVYRHLVEKAVSQR